MARSLAVLLVLALFFTTHSYAEPLKPAWSRPLGRSVRLVGVEENGRCILFADRKSIQIVSPDNAVLWTWPYASVSRFRNLSDVAVSPDCDAIAFVGDATYKNAWIAERNGKLVTLEFTSTPADVHFDRSGDLVAIGTFAGTMHLHGRNGELKWKRETKASIVQGIAFSDDNTHVMFKGWGGAGDVSVAGHVEWSTKEASDTEATDVSLPYYRWRIASASGGSRMWLRGEDAIDCVDARGTVLATITATPSERAVMVSRDFSQVFVVSEKDLDPVSVERYEVPRPCRP